jgi:hypothetical protein
MQLINWNETGVKFDLTNEWIKKYQHLLPKEVYRRASFTLKDVDVCFANCLRIVMLQGIRMRAFSVPRDCCIHTDDLNIRADTDMITNNIRQIAIKQIEQPRDSMFCIIVQNDTNIPRIVRVSDIKLYKYTPPASSQYFEHYINPQQTTYDMSKVILHDNVELCVLQPGKQLEITNITIVEGYGSKDAAAFVPVSPIGYSHARHYTGDLSTSATVIDPREINFTMETCGNFDLREVLSSAANSALLVLDQIRSDLTLHKSATNGLIYANEHMEVKNIGDQCYLYSWNNIPYEYVNAIAKQVFLCDENILRISSSTANTKSTGNIKIVASNATDRLLEAVDILAEQFSLLK